MNRDPKSAERILSIAFGFRNAKVLLSAVELGVFDALAEEPLDRVGLQHALDLPGRGAIDLFDALVAMGLLERDPRGRYSNAAETAAHLVSDRPCYVGDHLRYLNSGQYAAWGRLTDALRSGAAQAGPSGRGGFAEFYEDEDALERFMNGMSAGIVRPARALAEQFPWHRYASFADVGTADGCLAAEIAIRHPHLRGIGFDLRQVESYFARHAARRGLAERLRFVAGDFFTDPLPRADVIVLARVLHDWSVDQRRQLIKKAAEAVGPRGAVIAVEMLIDDERRINASAMLASLNMLLMTAAGSEATGADYEGWMRDAGLCDTRVLPLLNGYSALIGERAA